MKTLLPLTLGLLAATLTLLPRDAAAQSAADTVRIETKVQSESEKKDTGSKDPRAARAAEKTESKTLNISISGKAKSPETRTGKWLVYGREAKGHDVMVIDSGEFKIEFPASGPQKVDSKQVQMKFTPEHVEGAAKGKAGKKVDATGTKYAGWGVVVKDGDKVVGEAYDPMGIKNEAAK